MATLWKACLLYTSRVFTKLELRNPAIPEALTNFLFGRFSSTAFTSIVLFSGTSNASQIIDVYKRQVTYTITSKVPQNTQYYSDYVYTYTDTPSAGQIVDFDSLKVTVADKALTKDTDYTVAKNEDGAFTVTITTIENQTAGAAITVTYGATVTETEATGNKTVTNTVTLSDNGAKATDSTAITNGQFSFTKTCLLYTSRCV